MSAEVGLQAVAEPYAASLQLKRYDLTSPVPSDENAVVHYTFVVEA